MKRSAFLTVISGCVLAPMVLASIEKLDLPEMVKRVDSAVVGSITAKTTWTSPNPDGEGSLEFTTITVSGDDLMTGKPATVEVSFVGSDRVPTTVTPAESETRVGTRIVVFSKKSSAFGVTDAKNWMYASHGGVFRVEAGPKGEVVLGKGAGFAVSDNMLASDFRTRVTELRGAQKR